MSAHCTGYLNIIITENPRRLHIITTCFHLVGKNMDMGVRLLVFKSHSTISWLRDVEAS